jgi:hypothetical protein
MTYRILFNRGILMKKITFLLAVMLITSGLSGCIEQEQPVQDNNTTKPSYNSINSTQSGHHSFWSMLFWSSLWNRHVAPSIQTVKTYMTPDTAKKTDAPDLSKKADAKDPTDTVKKDSVSPDTGSKSKPKVKTTTTRIRRSGRR